MPMTSVPSDNLDSPMLSEEQLRAGTYSLLAGLLRHVPEPPVLQQLQDIVVTEPTDGLATAWLNLQEAATQVSLAELADEYQMLFIGLGRGEVVPYGSWYLTGFLMEKPLAQLRQELTELGFERQEGVHEPEDHAAALCEVMALLILDEAVDLDRQRLFFETHVGSWMDRFFHDLEHADSARFYRSVARLGQEFMSLEKRYLTMLV